MWQALAVTSVGMERQTLKLLTRWVVQLVSVMQLVVSQTSVMLSLVCVAVNLVSVGHDVSSVYLVSLGSPRSVASRVTAAVLVLSAQSAMLQQESVLVDQMWRV